MAKQAATNMTEGNILKVLVTFAIPILIGNVFQQIYNIADTAIIGNLLGDEALAAVGAAAPIYQLIVGLSIGLANGFAVIIARFFGANDSERLNRSICLTYALSIASTIIITTIGLLGIHPLLVFLKTPANIIEYTEEYMTIIISFSIATMSYNTLAAMLRAIGNSRAPLYFLVIATVINTGLDFLFIGTLKLGVAGAAYATVISQALSVVMVFIYIKKKCSMLLFNKTGFVNDVPIRNDLIATGLSMGMMSAIVSVGSVILQSAVNSFGTSTITAHIAARKVDDIFMLPLATLAMSTATFASQNYGAGKLDRVNKGIRTGISIAITWSVISACVAIPLCRVLTKLLTGTESEIVLKTASKYIVWNISFFTVLSILLILRSSLQGVGRKLIPITGSAVEFSLKILAVLFVAPKLGYFGVCILEPTIWVICAGIVLLDYRRFLKSAIST